MLGNNFEKCSTNKKKQNCKYNLTSLSFQTFNSFVFPYFNSNILYSINFFSIQCFFVVDVFLNDSN